MNNKKNGTDFEYEFCEILAENGFWCHRMMNNKNGQPADVIAAINGNPFLIDCKDCSNGVFTLSRIEENQRNAMLLWKSTGSGDGWFALRMHIGDLKDSVYMVQLNFLEKLIKRGVKSLDLTDVHAYDYLILPLRKWISYAGKRRYV